MAEFLIPTVLGRSLPIRGGGGGGDRPAKSCVIVSKEFVFLFINIISWLFSLSYYQKHPGPVCVCVCV